jgi:ATP-binding cassette subfamily B protein
LVWSTSKGLTLWLAGLTLLGGLLPGGIAYVGQLIVDAVIGLASQRPHVEGLGASALLDAARPVLGLIGLEAGLVVAMAAVQRGLGVCQSLLRALLGHRINAMILEKALTLELKHFEDAEFYDKLTKVRREASQRPLSLVNRTFSLLQNAISLVSYAGLLWQFSGWAVLVLVVAGLPAFFAETRFSGEAFRLFTWRTPETREQAYLEMVLAREDFAKEVKLFEWGPLFLQRFKAIFLKLYAEDRALTLRRGAWGFLLGLISTAAFYGAYGWIAVEAVLGGITLGAMTMYLMVFKQGQSGFAASLGAIGGMYEDNLYLSNFYDYMNQEVPPSTGQASQGPTPGDGVRFEDVWFAYPGQQEAALRGVSLHLRPGQKLALVGENGSGKTTLIKLLTRLYRPTRGRILLDGLELGAWDEAALRARVGVIFQDFVRLQMPVGENIGAGDVRHFDDERQHEEAARMGLALPFIEELPDRFKTQLGRWFKDGRELSGGQWQKIALSRAFMRRSADLLVLDEPTSAIDAESEAQIFEHFREAAKEQMAILISHRFSTVRMADHILVLDKGQVLEEGSHEALMALRGRYAHLFELQAAGYQ